MIAVQCSNDEKVKLTANPLTAGGRPAKFDGPLRIAVVSGDGTFTQDPATPNEFYVVSGDAVADPSVLGSGETVYSVEGDADLGAGVIPVNDQVALTVSQANAGSLGVVVGSPELK